MKYKTGTKIKIIFESYLYLMYTVFKELDSNVFDHEQYMKIFRG